jgi:hypothetical protein
LPCFCHGGPRYDATLNDLHRKPETCADCRAWIGRCLKGNKKPICFQPGVRASSGGPSLLTESVPGCYTDFPHAQAPNSCKKCDSELRNQCQLVAANKTKGSVKS